MYADDEELYVAFKPVDGGELATERVESSVTEMHGTARQYVDDLLVPANKIHTL